MPILAEYKDAATQAKALAAIVAGELRAALDARGRASLAVPGGTTPDAFLQALSHADIDWANVTVMLTDERFVPLTSPRSNTRLLRDSLLKGPAAAARLVPLYVDAASPEQVLEQLAAGVRAALPLDVCVLGMGADMHTASLFPGADRLDEALDPACPTPLLPMRAATAPEPRLTLTAPVLAGAQHVHLLIRGPDKRIALQAAEKASSASEAPIRVILVRDDLKIHYAETA